MFLFFLFFLSAFLEEKRKRKKDLSIQKMGMGSARACVSYWFKFQGLSFFFNSLRQVKFIRVFLE